MSEAGTEVLKGMPLKEAYSRVRKFYQEEGPAIIKERCIVPTDGYEPDTLRQMAVENPIEERMTLQLITNLPDSEMASPLEMEMVMDQISSGALEFAFNESDNQFSMGQYARTHLTKTVSSLSPEERKEIERSPIRPYFFDKIKEAQREAFHQQTN